MSQSDWLPTEDVNVPLQDSSEEGAPGEFLPANPEPKPISTVETPIRDVVYVKTQGYNYHKFTSFAYNALSTTQKHVILDLKCQQIPEQFIIQATTDIYVEFDKDADALSTPVVSANQSFTNSLRINYISVLGKSSSGTLYCWFYW